MEQRLLFDFFWLVSLAFFVNEVQGVIQTIYFLSNLSHKTEVEIQFFSITKTFKFKIIFLIFFSREIEVEFTQIAKNRRIFTMFFFLIFFGNLCIFGIFFFR